MKKVNDFLEKVSFKVNSKKQKAAANFVEFSRKTYLDKIWDNIKKYFMIYLLIILFIIFTILTKGALLEPNGFLLFLKNNSYILILAMGMLLVIVSGNIDLSIGTMVGLLAIFSIPIYNLTGSMIATFILTSLIGLLFGVVQGFLVGYIGIPAFVVTLGGFLVYLGFQLAVTKGVPFIPVDKVGFQNAVIGSFPDIKIAGSFWIFAFTIFILLGLLVVVLRFYGYLSKKRAGLKTSKLWVFILGQVTIFSISLFFGIMISLTSFGMPYYIIYALIFIIIFVFITQNTTFGRSVYAIGGNRKAAKLSGVNIKAVTFFIFVIMGMLAGFVGVIFAGIPGTAVSGAGQDLALGVISSVFIGGASVYGGVGTVAGTVIGSSIIQLISHFMELKGSVQSAQNIVKGLLLVIAVGLNVLINRKSN